MEWLWGYDTLPGSARDMLRYAAGSGARGHINFDGIGYEKMAVQAPEVIAELRAAIAAGTIVVGGSYGQPYGLFQGGESNVRQRIYGARTVYRLLGCVAAHVLGGGVRFLSPAPPDPYRSGVSIHFPVLPIDLVYSLPADGAGPPAIWWEALDSTRLLNAPRNDLNLHQWPDEFAGLMENPPFHRPAHPVNPAVAGIDALAGLDVPLRAYSPPEESAAG
jgi:alpha-mannosidase